MTRNSFIVGMASSLFVLLPMAGMAATAPRQEWTARWIAHPTAALREPGVFHFRKVIALASAPATYKVLVSADNRFTLFVNGQRVGDGPARGDLQHWRYETFDLGRYLHAGENVVAATVWNFGIYAPMAQVSDRTAFLVEGDTNSEAAVNTNESWSVEQEFGQICLPRPTNAYKEYFVAGPGERIDAARYDWTWMSGQDGPNSNWVRAGPAVRESVLFDGSHPMSHDHRNDTPWLLEADRLPPMQYRSVDNGVTVRVDGLQDNQPALRAFPGSPATIPAHATVSLLIARESVTTAYPRLTVSGGKCASIAITYAGALVDPAGNKGNRSEVGAGLARGLIDEFLPDGGAHRTFEPLWWRGYRYLELKITTQDQPLTIEKLETFFTAYPFQQKAYFRSSDEEMNRIWSTAWYTATLNAHETYVDSAAVEQLQYVADIRPQLLVSYAVAGDDRLARQAIDAIDDSRIPEGLTQSRYPNNIFQVIDGYSLLWIGMLHDFWAWRTDPEFVSDHLLGTRTVLDWFMKHQGEDGMLTRLPFGVWQDWVGKDDRTFPRFDAMGRSSLITLQYVVALRQAAELEDAMGYKFLAQLYRSRAELARTATYRLCWDSSAGLLADTPDRNSFSQQVNAYAVLADSIPSADQRDVLQRMSSEEYPDFLRSAVKIDRSSFYFRYYTARAMEHAGMEADFARMLAPWRAMLHNGFTTFPETPEPTREEAQGWCAHPILDLLVMTAGIHPQGVGFRSVRISPNLGDLTSLEAGMESPQGLIEVTYHRSKGHLQAEITLPGTMTGELVVEQRHLSLKPGKQHIELMLQPQQPTAKGNNQ